jgi:hypothetical protein
MCSWINLHCTFWIVIFSYHCKGDQSTIARLSQIVVPYAQQTIHHTTAKEKNVFYIRHY